MFNFNKSQAEIRLMLHPSINKEALPITNQLAKRGIPGDAKTQNLFKDTSHNKSTQNQKSKINRDDAGFDECRE